MIRERRFAELDDTMTALMTVETEPDVRFDLMSDLSMLLRHAGEEQSALDWAQRICCEYDVSPFAWYSLARWHQFTSLPGRSSQENLLIALGHLETALERARAANEWVRYVLFDICRLLRDLKDYPRLEATMREILDDLNTRREIDIPRIEGEWLDHIPEGCLDADLVERYRRVLVAEKARLPRHGYYVYPATLDDLGL